MGIPHLTPSPLPTSPPQMATNHTNLKKSTVLKTEVSIELPYALLSITLLAKSIS